MVHGDAPASYRVSRHHGLASSVVLSRYSLPGAGEPAHLSHSFSWIPLGMIMIGSLVSAKCQLHPKMATERLMLHPPVASVPSCFQNSSQPLTSHSLNSRNCIKCCASLAEQLAEKWHYLASLLCRSRKQVSSQSLTANCKKEKKPLHFAARGKTGKCAL